MWYYSTNPNTTQEREHPLFFSHETNCQSRIPSDTAKQYIRGIIMKGNMSLGEEQQLSDNQEDGNTSTVQPHVLMSIMDALMLAKNQVSALLSPK